MLYVANGMECNQNEAQRASEEKAKIKTAKINNNINFHRFAWKCRRNELIFNVAVFLIPVLLCHSTNMLLELDFVDSMLFF